jgi:hypothetical protein
VGEVEGLSGEGTEKDAIEAELKKFSISRSNELAKFLNELARALISWRSASAESRTSFHPREIKEKAVLLLLVLVDVEVASIVQFVQLGFPNFLKFGFFFFFFFCREFFEEGKH